MRYAIGGFLLLLCAIVGIGWVARGNDFFLARYFAPKAEAVRREVFKESQAYNDGMAQELAAAQLDYAKAGPDQRLAIGSIMLHRFGAYDAAKLTPDQRAFLIELRQGQIGGGK